MPVVVLLSAAISSFTLVFLSAPGNTIAWLAAVWFVPLAIVLRQLSAKQSALYLGLVLSMIWLLSVWWLAPALMRFADVSGWLAWPLLAVICAGCALPYAVAGLLLPSCRNRSVCITLVLQALVLSSVVTALPSLIPGDPLHGLFRQPELLQSLAIGGMPLWFFLFFCFQLALAECLVAVMRRQRPPLAACFIAVTLAIAIPTSGHWQLQQFAKAPAQTLSIGLVQPSLGRDDNTGALLALSHALLQKERVDVLVWPELTPAFSVVENTNDLQYSRALAERYQTPILLNSGYVYRRDRHGKRINGYYNANQLVTSDGITAHYQKQLLVPFFEYLPLPQLKRWFPSSLHYVAGPDRAPIALNDQVRLATPICYEIIFPDYVGQLIKQGANVIINPVSDGWFGNSRASYYHLALASLRSVEHRVAIVRAANTGVSAVIAASGEILNGTQTDLFTATALASELAIPSQRSVYSAWQGKVEKGFLLLALFGLVANRYWRLRQS
jgi:apolipoprotein N-acyltransferase